MTTNPAAVSFTQHGPFATRQPLPSAYMTSLDQFAQDMANASVFIMPRAALTASGVVNVSPVIQAAYDSGDRIIDCDPKGVYLLDSGMFIDGTVAETQRLLIRGNGAKFILGPNLPRSNWSGDSTTRFAFFPNTSRAALVSGVVTVNDANRATGSGGALRSLVVLDAVIDGQSANRGFCMANRTPVTFERCILDDARVASTWYDYTDMNAYVDCYSRGNGYAGQRFLDQTAQGDGLIVIGPKADSSTEWASIVGCHGAHIMAPVTARFTFSNCTHIKIDGGHQEGQQANATTLTIKNSHVVVDSTVIYENENTTPAIIVDDSAGNIPSVVTLKDCSSMQLHTTATGSTVFGPLFSIVPNNGTRIFVDRMRYAWATSAMAGERYDGVAPYVTGSAAVLAAFNTDGARVALASGTWSFRRRASGTYAVDGPVEGVTLSVAQLGAPDIVQTTTDSGVNTGGTLPASLHSYAAYVVDGRGQMGPVSVERTVTPGAKGGVRLYVDLPNGPSVLVLTRKVGAGAASTPTHYVVIPTTATGRTYFIDTALLNGRAWQTASPPTPGATNNTRSGVIIEGVFLYAESGALKVRGGSGTVTTIAPA